MKNYKSDSLSVAALKVSILTTQNKIVCLFCVEDQTSRFVILRFGLV
jgi:hypothetical protein